MDDLLALMENEDGGDENALLGSTSPSSSSDDKDDESNGLPDIQTKETSSSSVIISQRSAHQSNYLKKKKKQSTAALVTPSQGREPPRAEASIDEKIGIRVVKRILPSMELLDIISTSPYHSTATLAAMSRAALNRILIEPATIVSDATVCGKTDIVTVGIVFTNTGTRISANGRAFSVLSIGNLYTGPVVSVFLFGDAYGKHCRKVPPGTVICLQSPQLVPPKDNNNSQKSTTTVAFSIRDERQLLLVGNARDYATCKGEVRMKPKQSSTGQWVSNTNNNGSGMTKCQNYVDTRISLYCTMHRKQQTSKKNGGGGSLSFIQNLRANALPGPFGTALQNSNGTSSLRAGNNGGVRNDNSASLSSTNTNTDYSRSMFAGRTNSQVANAMVMSTPAGPAVTHVGKGGNGGLGLGGGNARASLKPSLRAPMHMKKDTPFGNSVNTTMHRAGLTAAKSSSSSSSLSNKNKSNVNNPYVSNRNNPFSATNQTKVSIPNNKASAGQSTTLCSKRPVRDDWLLQSNARRKKKTPLTSTTNDGGVSSCIQKKKKRNINMDTADFNGSVPVPKPNKLFRSAATTGCQQNSRAAVSQAGFTQTDVEDIRERQKRLAQVILENTTSDTEIGNKQGVAHPNVSGKLQLKKKQLHGPGAAKSSSKDSLFGNLNNIDAEKVLATKSRFATEADAEEYARNRKTMLELERQELLKENRGNNKKIQQNGKDNKSDANKKESSIQKEWFCTVCKKTSSNKPVFCMRRDHKVILSRKVKSTKSTSDRILGLRDKDVKDGGLSLGSGVEWSRWRGS